MLAGLILSKSRYPSRATNLSHRPATDRLAWEPRGPTQRVGGQTISSWNGVVRPGSQQKAFQLIPAASIDGALRMRSCQLTSWLSISQRRAFSSLSLRTVSQGTGAFPRYPLGGITGGVGRSGWAPDDHGSDPGKRVASPRAACFSIFPAAPDMGMRAAWLAAMPASWLVYSRAVHRP